ncbi:amidohydrolase family protein [Parafrigoribacterium mesophilum]|uniref:dihydroorotase n=1 Tax=Parafrigoribacterium mesophilum TaxID=433646 RepID=UPI0031FC4AC2
MSDTSTPTVPYDLRLTGARAMLPGVGLSEVDICVRDGRVAAIVSRDDTATAGETVDLTGRVILPGAIDAHVHLGKNIAAPEEPIDASAETASAVAGGMTTILAYLIGPGPYETPFANAVKVMEQYSHTDFGFHFCIVTQDQIEALPSYVADLGVSSFKFFMNFRGEEGAYLGVPGADDSFMYDLLSIAVKSGAMINAHAENVELIWRLRKDVPKTPDAGLVGWNATRPPFVEAEASQRVAYLARVLGASYYGVHVSSGEALDALSGRKAEYENIFLETCPHYLTLDTSSPMGSRAKVNPPVRPEGNQDALWEGVRDGRIDTIGSDHVPRHFTAKDKDIWSASAGFPGSGTLLPTMISEAHLRRGIPLERIVELTSTRPAQLFGLYPRKGQIAVGSDADFAVVDMNGHYTITAATQHSAAEYSVWEGKEVDCRITDTIIRGQFAVRDGVLQPAIGAAYLPRAHSGEAALKAAGLR